MRFITIITTFLLSFIFNTTKTSSAIYVMYVNSLESIDIIIDKCNVKDNENGIVNILNINTNYDIKSATIGEYFITFDAVDEHDNKSRLTIRVIVLPPMESTHYIYRSNKTTKELLDDFGLNCEYVNIIEDTYTNHSKIAGEYKIKFMYSYINDFCVTINIVVLDDEISSQTPIICPLYNRINNKQLRQLVALNMGLKEEEIFSVKGKVDVYHEGLYKLLVMTTNNNIKEVVVIIKEMLPQKEVTLEEKLYLYLTIFFNLDGRYKTNNFYDFETRIKCISQIYTTGMVRC